MGRKNAKTKKNKEKHRPSSSGKMFKGKLDITRSGMGFITIEGMDIDILVRPGDFNTAYFKHVLKSA